MLVSMPALGAAAKTGAVPCPPLYPDADTTRSTGHRRAVTVDAVDTADRVSKQQLLVPCPQPSISHFPCDISCSVSIFSPVLLS